MVLSEAVYKAVDYGDAGAADMLAAIVRSFPPSLLGIQRVQWTQPQAHHRRAPRAETIEKGLQEPTQACPLGRGTRRWALGRLQWA